MTKQWIRDEDGMILVVILVAILVVTSPTTSYYIILMAILVVILVLIHNTQGRRWDDADLVGCFRGQLGGTEAARWPRVDDHIHHYGVHGNAEDVQCSWWWLQQCWGATPRSVTTMATRASTSPQPRFQSQSLEIDTGNISSPGPPQLCHLLDQLWGQPLGPRHWPALS